MSKSIHEPNFTQVPNVIFDYWMHELDHCTSLVLLFLCRKTFGWQKTKDSLSLTKIESGLKMSRNRVIKSLKILEEHKLIIKQHHTNCHGDKDPNTYELIIHEGVVHDVNHVVHEMNYPGSAPHALGVVHEMNIQKKDIQNKNNNVVVVAPEQARCSSLNKPVDPRGKFTKDDLYFRANKEQRDWTSQEIEEAWSIFSESKIPITSPFEYIEGVIKKKRVIQNAKKQTNNKKDTKCKRTRKNYETVKREFSQELESSNLETSERGMSKHPLANWRSMINPQK